MIGAKAAIGKCFFSVEKVKQDGTIEHCGHHTNLILDSGLTGLLSGTGFRRFRLGSGSAPVERTQTALAAQLSGGMGSFLNSSNGVTTTGTDSGGFYVQWVTSGQSPVFSVSTNVTEIGFSTEGTNVFLSRSLTKNSAGVPTAITVLPAESLIVTYTFKLYMPSGSETGSISVTTDGVVGSSAWTSIPRSGAAYNIGTGFFLNFIFPANSIWYTTNDIYTLDFLRNAPVIQPYGASMKSYVNKAGGTGAISVTRFRSNGTARSIPVDISFSPAIEVTNDQRATFEYTDFITQDYT